MSKKAERQERNKDKSGVNVQLWARVTVITVPDEWAGSTGKERSEILLGADTTAAYIPAASENEGIRTVQDAKDWMEENNFVGTVMAVGRRNWGAERTGCLTRAEQKVFVIS